MMKYESLIRNDMILWTYVPRDTITQIINIDIPDIKFKEHCYFTSLKTFEMMQMFNFNFVPTIFTTNAFIREISILNNYKVINNIFIYDNIKFHPFATSLIFKDTYTNESLISYLHKIGVNIESGVSI